MCGRRIDADDWHADHIVPYCLTKRTVIHEMQALCPPCNLRKGASVFKPRLHQQQVVDRVKGWAASSERSRSLVVSVVPGGGKSMLPTLALGVLPSDYRLAWFVPRLSLRRQGAADALAKAGVQIRESGNEPDPARCARGFVATHQTLVRDPGLWASYLRRGKWLLVVDEVHHACIRSDGTPNELAAALDRLPYSFRLLMTGTLERHARTERVYGVEYYETEDDGWYVKKDDMVVYDRKLGLKESPPAIVPVVFEHHDGPVRWKCLETGVENEVTLSESDDPAAKMTAIQTGLAKSLLNNGLDHWRRNSAGKALVVCRSQADARRWLTEARKYGTAAVALSDDGDAALAAIRDFQERSDPKILLTVAMAYEGLNVPAITHGICLTAYRSRPWLEQMFARAWRAVPGKERCFWWVPDDPMMNTVIKQIHDDSESAVVMSRRESGGEGKSSSDGPDAFVPLGSETNETRTSGLGVEVKYSLDQQQALDIWKARGLPEDSPVVQAFLAAIAAAPVQHSVPEQKTYREQECELRKQISSIVGRHCAETDSDHSYVNADINRYMGVSARNMATIPQLERGLTYASGKYARPTR